MAISPLLNNATIARTQDFTTIKQNEDQKGLIDQANFGHQFKKEVDSRPHQVNRQDNADFHNRKFDEKDKGDNQYSGDGGKNRRKQEEELGKVIIKGRGGFDMKI